VALSIALVELHSQFAEHRIWPLPPHLRTISCVIWEKHRRHDQPPLQPHQQLLQLRRPGRARPGRAAADLLGVINCDKAPKPSQRHDACPDKGQ